MRKTGTSPCRNEWVTEPPGHLADWDLRIFEDEVELVSIKAETSNDEDFTSEK